MPHAIPWLIHLTICEVERKKDNTNLVHPSFQSYSVLKRQQKIIGLFPLSKNPGFFFPTRRIRSTKQARLTCSHMALKRVECVKRREKRVNIFVSTKKQFLLQLRPFRRARNKKPVLKDTKKWMYLYASSYETLLPLWNITFIDGHFVQYIIASWNCLLNVLKVYNSIRKFFFKFFRDTPNKLYSKLYWIPK